ncbi:YeeE/YedE family protein [Oceaniovalibus sp. ACAM 378]|uniref:YeeE/YedE family protein n=1 Tax=Oceaniovalibus sp. ACAM 378 TaxID=2599923 RepID=UPI0011D5C749|nr:YeeE/YedE family protein [Oceaniovalibus sp. ACAM 378]TYB87191.1 YeeE/YedE family protein [Oceaniovalibus sp. ACAM 378]
MLYDLSDGAILALIGLGGGVIFGLAARLGRFCTLGAIEDFLYQGSDTRLRMWGLAIGIAGIGAFTLVGLGAMDPTQTIYHLSPFSPAFAIIGGLMFGYGMSLAGNCGFGALARFGGGDLRSFVIVVVMGISGYVMLSGPLAHLRLAGLALTEISTQTRSYPQILSELTGISIVPLGLLISAAITGFALWSHEFLRNPKAILWGALVGCVIVSGWGGTQWVANTGFSASPINSHTFTSPLGETLLYLMTSSGGGLTFGVGSVFGVLVGAFIGSLFKGHFRWEACEDPRELKRQVLGAVLMGFGAILAMGCTIGQGISAFSLLTINAPIVFVSIFTGAALGLRQLIAGLSFG